MGILFVIPEKKRQKLLEENQSMSTNVTRCSSQQTVLCVSWEEMEGLTLRIAHALLAQGKPDVLIGLQRGGVIPTVILSHLLATEMVVLPIRRTLSDAIYAAKQAPVAHVSEQLQLLRGKDVVLVDDIVGSGETLRAAHHIIAASVPSRIRSVVSIVNRAHWDEANQTNPQASITHIGREVHGWVVFPWETKPEERTPGMGV